MILSTLCTPGYMAVERRITVSSELGPVARRRVSRRLVAQPAPSLDKPETSEEGPYAGLYRPGGEGDGRARRPVDPDERPADAARDAPASGSSPAVGRATAVAASPADQRGRVAAGCGRAGSA